MSDSSIDSTQRSQFYGRKKSRPLRKSSLDLIETLLPKLEIDLDNINGFIDPCRINWLEIGFGGGEHLASQAERNRGINFIGCEPFLNGVASFLKHYMEKKLDNVYIYTEDARFLLARIPEASIDRVFVLFPDPWPKKRHNKRRIINSDTINDFYRIIKPGGMLRIASDDPSYVEWIWEHMQRACVDGKFSSLAKDLSGFKSSTPCDWVQTRYELKAKKAGRECYYMDFMRK